MPGALEFLDSLQLLDVDSLKSLDDLDLDLKSLDDLDWDLPLYLNQKQARIAAQLAETPEASDRAIGRMLKVDGKTVAVVRRALAEAPSTIQGEKNCPA